MPDIQPSAARAADPARIITEAINAAIDRGLTVSSKPDLGVHCTSTWAPTWAPDPRSPAVSPLGAVLLAAQPQVSEPTAALVAALGVGSLFAEGFDAGCDGAKPSETLQKGPDAPLYRQGYALGVETRIHLHRVGSGLRAVVTVSPGQLIDQLLNSLTCTQALDKLAAIEHQRAARYGGAAREIHEDAAGLIETLAETLRNDGI